MNEIIWLASYPKSGNTWFRTFISNLLNEKDEDVSINHLRTDGIFSSRNIFDMMTGIESSDLTQDEADVLRPQVYNYLAQNLKKNLFIKVHDAYTYLPDGSPIMGTVNAKAIYIIRNPLDVSVSFSNHLSKDLDKTIQIMGDSDFAFCSNQKAAANQLRQRLLTWSMHADSWMKASEIDVHFVRYEDMKLNALETFQKAVAFIGLNFDEEQIGAAIMNSDFHVLKEQEEKNGFGEKPSHTKSFFRKGEVGDWRNHLREDQVEALISDHADVMKRFGYLDSDNRPIY